MDLKSKKTISYRGGMYLLLALLTISLISGFIIYRFSLLSHIKVSDTTLIDEVIFYGIIGLALATVVVALLLAVRINRNIKSLERVATAMENGADKIRINPGNIGDMDKVKAVVDVAKERNIPIRVGVNSGSLEKNILEKYGKVTAEGIVESALDKVKMIEDLGYDNLVISIKSSDVMMCAKAHELIATKTNYPIHVGITEAGTLYSGNIKSSIGLGIILGAGIGNTIRVSLTGDPLEEIKSAKLILKTLGLREGGITVVSCPTCGRTRIDLIGLANQVETMVSKYDHLDIKVAVMGCVVNGPGEAKEADIGIAGGIGEGLLIKRGEIVAKIPESELLSTLEQELINWPTK